MTQPSEFLVYAGLAAVTFIAILGISFTGRKLADAHGSDIRIVWYLASLSMVCTLTVAIWASSAGVIDADGRFKGQWGAALHSLLTFMLDLDTDIKVLVAILVIFVLPQAISYLLSGLFGCASAPIFVGKAVTLFVWSVVKSFVVVAGILLTVSLYGWLKGWESWNLRGAASMACLAIVMLAVSFFCLFMYRDIESPQTEPSTRLGRSVMRWLRACTRWMTRKSQPAST